MKKYVYFSPAVLYILFNFYLSSLTWSEVRRDVGWVKNIPQKESLKIRHIVQYSPLSFSISYGLSRTFLSLSGNRIFFLSIIIGTLDGAFEEIHQSFVPSRIPSLIDVLWDFLGVFVGASLFKLINPRKI